MTTFSRFADFLSFFSFYAMKCNTILALRRNFAQRCVQKTAPSKNDGRTKMLELDLLHFSSFRVYVDDFEKWNDISFDALFFLFFSRIRQIKLFRSCICHISFSDTDKKVAFKGPFSLHLVNWLKDRLLLLLTRILLSRSEKCKTRFLQFCRVIFSMDEKGCCVAFDGEKKKKEEEKCIFFLQKLPPWDRRAQSDIMRTECQWARYMNSNCFCINICA